MTYIRPDALIFTGVIHKEGDTSDIHKTRCTDLHCCYHKEGDTSDRDTVTYIRPDAPIFTAVIHKEGDTSDIHKT